MAYLGNNPNQQAFTPAVDYFNGTGSATAFTLSRPVASVAQVQVTIENVPQNPSSSFTVSGSTITFTSAPPSGTNNIYVQYTSLITQTLIAAATSGEMTNITGTAAGFTAGNVTTNANLTGEATSIGNAVTVTNSAVIGKVLTGYVSGAGVVAATDTILQAIQKLNGNAGGAAGGSTGQMQYNNAGAFAGAVNVTVNNNDLTILENNSPVTPPASTCKVFSKNVANRQFLAFVGPSGQDTSVQPLLGRNKIAWYVPTMGSSLTTAIGMSLSSTGTATGVAWANTNIVTSTSRLNFRAVASTSSVCGIRSPTLQYWRGNAAGLGGFTFISRFSIGQAATTPTTTTLRCFVGLRNITTAPTDLPPSGFINSIGAGWESGSTTLQIYCAGTVMSQVNTSVPLVRTVEATLYDVAIFCPPFGTTVSVMVTNVGTGETQTALFDAVATPTLVPVNTLGLCPNSFMSAGGTNTTMGFNLHSLYIETDE